MGTLEMSFCLVGAVPKTCNTLFHCRVEGNLWVQDCRMAIKYQKKNWTVQNDNFLIYNQLLKCILISVLG